MGIQIPEACIYFFGTGILDFSCSPDYIHIGQELRAHSFFLFCMDSILHIFLLHYFPNFFILNFQSLLKLMDATKDSPDVKQDLLNRLFSGKRMT